MLVTETPGPDRRASRGPSRRLSSWPWRCLTGSKTIEAGESVTHPSPRAGRCQQRKLGHWGNLLRQIHSALASRPSRSARTATLRAPWQPSTWLAHARPALHIRSPRRRLRRAQPHVRLGRPARSRLVWLATCPSAGDQIDALSGAAHGSPTSHRAKSAAVTESATAHRITLSAASMAPTSAGGPEPSS